MRDQPSIVDLTKHIEVVASMIGANVCMSYPVGSSLGSLGAADLDLRGGEMMAYEGGPRGV
jgi:hypothetical protein